MKKAFKGGLDLKFLPSAVFEEMGDLPPAQKNPLIARNALRLLMMGASKDWANLVSLHTFNAVFFYHDTAILKELRFAFQQGFEYLYEQLKDRELNEDEAEQFQLYLSNCLSLLPYTDLSGYESIKIPQIINKKWVLVEYAVTPIELTPPRTSWLDKLLIRDHDRVFSYGLEAITEPKAQSHLIFMGTTYPAGQGFWPQLVADSKGFETVGKSLYVSGKERITSWLKAQKEKIHVCGVSLGGSLSLQLAIDQGEYIQRVDALNPAGLHDSWHKSQYDQWEKIAEKPQVVVQKQANDPVSAFGVWKKEWEIIKVKPSIANKGPNSFFDHFLNYAGSPDAEFTYGDPEQENLKRKGRNFWLYSVGRSFVYYFVAVPYFYAIRPTGYFIAEHWLTLTLSTISLLAASTASVLATQGALFGLIATSLISLLSVGATITHESLKSPEPTKPFAKIHDPALPRNPSMDIYSKEHQIEVEFSEQQIETYSKVIKLIDQEPASPVHKKMIKAKAMHIKRVLTVVEQRGEVGAREVVAEDYRQYNLGKLPGM